jgi:hypothetical protein
MRLLREALRKALMQATHGVSLLLVRLQILLSLLALRLVLLALGLIVLLLSARVAAFPGNGSRQIRHGVNASHMLQAAIGKRNQISSDYYGFANGVGRFRVGCDAKIQRLVGEVKENPNFGFVFDPTSAPDVARASEELGRIFGQGNLHVVYHYGWGHQIRASLECFIEERGTEAMAPRIAFPPPRMQQAAPDSRSHQHGGLGATSSVVFTPEQDAAIVALAVKARGRPRILWCSLYVTDPGLFDRDTVTSDRIRVSIVSWSRRSKPV